MDFEELDEEAAAMAVAMGFSTFGSHKPPAKKRKFNPATDAFVSGQELENIDRGGKKGQGSGGNTMPLGKMRTFGSGEKKVVSANEDEIDEDEDEDEQSQTIQPISRRREMNLPAVSGSEMEKKDELDFGRDTGPIERKTEGNGYGSRLPVRKHTGNQDEINLDKEEDDQDGGANVIQPEGADGPSYIDTSHTPPADAAPLDPSDPEAIEMQARIDAILASIEEGQTSAESPIPEREEEAASLQHTPNHPGQGGRGGKVFNDTASIASSRPSHGGRNPRWYEGYYDPSFNENPWKKLEDERGLKSLGTWLESSNNRSRGS